MNITQADLGRMDKKTQLSLMQENRMYLVLNDIDTEALELWAVVGTKPNGEPVPGLFGTVHADFLPKIRTAIGTNDDELNDELWADLKDGMAIEIELAWTPHVEI